MSFFFSQNVVSFAKDRLLQGETRSLRLETYIFRKSRDGIEKSIGLQDADIHTVGKNCEK